MKYVIPIPDGVTIDFFLDVLEKETNIETTRSRPYDGMYVLSKGLSTIFEVGIPSSIIDGKEGVVEVSSPHGLITSDGINAINERLWAKYVEKIVNGTEENSISQEDRIRCAQEFSKNLKFGNLDTITTVNHGELIALEVYYTGPRIDSLGTPEEISAFFGKVMIQSGLPMWHTRRESPECYINDGL